ncbi:MAG: Phenylacetic acid catabolic protein [Halieaceae bacterium]
MSERAKKELTAEMLCIADSDWVLGHWYIKVMLNGRSLTDCSAFAGMAQDTLGHTRAMFRYLEEELDLPEHQLEFGRSREQLHDMQMLSSPPENWGDFLVSTFLAEVALWRMLNTFKDSSAVPSIKGMVKHFGKELYFHRIGLEGWLKAADESDHNDIKEAVIRRVPQVLAWFDSKERSGTDLLLQEGVRSSSVWDARLGFVEESLGKLANAVGMTDEELTSIMEQGLEGDWDSIRRRTSGSILPDTLWEFMIPTDADTVSLRRPLAVSIDDNLDLFDRAEYAEDD